MNDEKVYKKPAYIGVSLTQEELSRLSLVAQTEGVTRHAVVQYAVRDFLARYERGERPKKEYQTVTKLIPSGQY